MSLDTLLSLPYRYELLSLLTRSQTLVLSAIIFAARVRAPAQWFRLSDETIMQQTGLSRATVWRCKQRLKALGLVDQWQNRNTGYFRITEEQMNKILNIANTTMTEQVQRVMASFEPPLRTLAHTIHEIAGARPAFSWRIYLTRLLEAGVTPEELAQAIEDYRARGVQVLNAAGAWKAVMSRRKRLKFEEMRAKRASKAAKAEKTRRVFYHYIWDSLTGEYRRVPLPEGATEDIIDLPEVKHDYDSN